VLPDIEARQTALPVVNDRGKYLNNETVIAIITPKYANVSILIPILRPLLPQRAFIAAYAPTNQIIIADTYKNIKKLQQIINSLDLKEQHKMIQK
jgi:general secretion pathway protein D